MGKVIRIRFRDKQPGSYFRELRNIFWVKILKFFDAAEIRDGNNLDPGWKKFESGIRNKHPGSATLTAIAPQKLLMKITVNTTHTYMYRNSTEENSVPDPYSLNPIQRAAEYGSNTDPDPDKILFYKLER
jgi:hypothetical protein